MWKVLIIYSGEKGDVEMCGIWRLGGKFEHYCGGLETIAMGG